MAFIPATNVVQTFIEFLYPNSVIVGNVVNHIDTLGVPTPARVLECAQRIANWWDVNMQQHVSSQVSLVATRSRSIHVADGPIADNVLIPPLAGGAAPGVLPGHTTIALSLRTGLAGKSRRGRLYHVGLTEGNVLGDFVNTAAGGVLATAYGVFKTEMALNGFTWCIVSRFANKLPRTQALVTAISAVFFVDLRVDTQRRRLAGEGT